MRRSPLHCARVGLRLPALQVASWRPTGDRSLGQMRGIHGTLRQGPGLNMAAHEPSCTRSAYRLKKDCVRTPCHPDLLRTLLGDAECAFSKPSANRTLLNCRPRLRWPEICCASWLLRVLVL